MLALFSDLFSLFSSDHFHSYWSDEKRSSATTCLNAGGHYDPYLACGPSSEEKAGLCLQLNRTTTQDYAYACNVENYSSGHYNLCEVGDISGKFGRMTPAEGTLVFKGDMIDPNPPMDAHFGEGDLLAKQWSSMVFHCPADNARLFCAQFVREKCAIGEKC